MKKITSAEIEQRLACLETLMARDAGDLGSLLEAAGEVDALRDAYRQQPQAFERKLRDLQHLTSTLRRRLAAVRDDLAQLLGRFTADLDAISEVVSLARTAFEESLHGDPRDRVKVGDVTARRAQRLRLPTGDGQREELESILRTSGLWERVSALSSPRLAALVKSHDVPEPDHTRITSLCSISEGYTITVDRAPRQVRTRTALQLLAERNVSKTEPIRPDRPDQT